eukprot:1910259-Amphidinium_carterae.1
MFVCCGGGGTVFGPQLLVEIRLPRHADNVPCCDATAAPKLYRFPSRRHPVAHRHGMSRSARASQPQDLIQR